MKRVVFWTGVYNIILGATFLVPALPSLLGVNLPSPLLWVWTPAVFVIYLGIALILCSRQLADRATLVYWEGILRIAAFCLFAGFGFLDGQGVVVGLIGVVDLLIGLVYLTALPKALHRTPADLLLDRVAKVAPLAH